MIGVETVHEDNFTLVKRILADFRHFEFILKMLKEYGNQAQAALVPKPFINHFADSLKDIITPCFNNDQATNNYKLSRLAENLIENTSKPIKVTSTTTFDDFMNMFSGENYRLETIGMLQCTAGRACSLGLARDDDKHQDLVLALYRNTAACLRLCRRIATDNNDVMTWMAFDYLRLTTHVEGDTSPPVYRRVGDLSTVSALPVSVQDAVDLIILGSIYTSLAFSASRQSLETRRSSSLSVEESFLPPHTNSTSSFPRSSIDLLAYCAVSPMSNYHWTSPTTSCSPVRPKRRRKRILHQTGGARNPDIFQLRGID